MKNSGAELSIIVPTFNEKNNIEEIVRRLDKVLDGIFWEVIFVDDDSSDGTAVAVRNIGRQDIRIRCIQRIGRRGLSAACIEGMLSSSAPYLAVMDGDLQHDEKLLHQMLNILKSGDIDIVVGSRYVQDGRIGNWNKKRAKISRFATRIGQIVIKTELSDPMSGYFMVTRQVFEANVRNLSGIGFKILLDLLASSPRKLRIREIPYQFRSRVAGQSKLDSQVAWDFGMLLVDKLIGNIIPVRFVAFCIIGGLGVPVHLLTLSLLFKMLKMPFSLSQLVATLVAMTFNFSLNNVLTYRDMRLHGLQWLRGWISFTLVCGIGAFANVGIASYFYSMNQKWFSAALFGICVGAVWNYAVTSVYTWQKTVKTS